MLDGKLAAAAADCRRLSAALEEQWPALLDDKPRDPQVNERSCHAESSAPASRANVSVSEQRLWFGASPGAG